MSLRISQSGLNKYSLCQEQWRMSHFWQEIDLPQHIKDGLAAHEIMAGEKVDNPNKRVSSLVKNLKKAEEELGLKINFRELKQEFVYEGVNIIRIVDALGETANGLPVMIDYKTTRPGKAMSYAQARGWQSAMYLVPPTSGPAEWPKVIFFVIASEKKLEAVYTVEYDEKRERELKAKIAEIKSHYDKYGLDFAPRNFGYHCRFCPFLGSCNEEPTWKVGLEKKEYRK